MQHDFRDWFACPDCDERAGISTLAHGTDIVFECHECGLISEFVIGEDISLRNLDIEAISELEEDRSCS